MRHERTSGIIRVLPGRSLLALAVIVGACSGSPTQEFGRTDQDRIREMSRQLAAAFNAKDVARLLGFYSITAAVMPPNSATVRGQEPIKSFIEALLADGVTDLQVEAKEISGHGALAYESGTYSLRRRPPGGGAEVRDRGKYISVLREFAGQWRYEYMIWNSDLPPAS